MKKAQMEMVETITVLIVFFIIFFIGLYVYYHYSYQNIEETATTFKESEYTTLLYAIASSPEFSCQKGNCIDISKLEALKELNYKLFRKTVKVTVIYPESAEIYEFSAKSITENKDIYEIPISLYYPEKDEFKIGKLSIIVYT